METTCTSGCCSGEANLCGEIAFMSGFCRPISKAKQKATLATQTTPRNGINHEKLDPMTEKVEDNDENPLNRIITSLKQANPALEFDPTYLMDDDLWFNIFFRQVRNISRTLSINDLWYKHICPLRITEDIPLLSEWKLKYEEQVQDMDEPGRRVLLAVIIRHFLIRGVEVHIDRKVLPYNDRRNINDLLENRFYTAMVLAMQMINPRRSKQFLISSCTLLEGDISDNMLPTSHLIGKHATNSTKNREKIFEKLCSRRSEERELLIRLPNVVSMSDMQLFTQNREKEKARALEDDDEEEEDDDDDRGPNRSGKKEEEEVQLDEETTERMRQYLLSAGGESEELMAMLQADIEDFELDGHLLEGLLASARVVEGVQEVAGTTLSGKVSAAVDVNTRETADGRPIVKEISLVDDANPAVVRTGHHGGCVMGVEIKETIFDDNAYLDVFYAMADELLEVFDDIDEVIEEDLVCTESLKEVEGEGVHSEADVIQKGSTDSVEEIEGELIVGESGDVVHESTSMMVESPTSRHDEYVFVEQPESEEQQYQEEIGVELNEYAEDNEIVTDEDMFEVFEMLMDYDENESEVDDHVNNI